VRRKVAKAPRSGGFATSPRKTGSPSLPLLQNQLSLITKAIYQFVRIVPMNVIHFFIRDLHNRTVANGGLSTPASLFFYEWSDDVFVLVPLVSHNQQRAL